MIFVINSTTEEL